MKANITCPLTVILLTLFAQLVFSSPIFVEDWETGTIDTSIWNKVEWGDTTLIQQIKKDGTNHSLAQEIGAENKNGYVYIETKDSFDADNGLTITYRQYRIATDSPKSANFKIFAGSTLMMHLDWVANTGMLYGYRRINGNEQTLPSADLGNYLNQWTDWTIVYSPEVQPTISIQAYAGSTKIYDASAEIDLMDNVKLQFKTWNKDSHYNKCRWDDITIYIPEPASLLLMFFFTISLSFSRILSQKSSYLPLA